MITYVLNFRDNLTVHSGILDTATGHMSYDITEYTSEEAMYRCVRKEFTHNIESANNKEFKGL